MFNIKPKNFVYNKMGMKKMKRIQISSVKIIIKRIIYYLKAQYSILNYNIGFEVRIKCSLSIFVFIKY